MQYYILNRRDKGINKVFCWKSTECLIKIFYCILFSGELPNLHIANLFAVDFESDSGAHFVGTIFSCCSRVDVEQVIDRVIDDFEDVRVSRNEDFGSACLNFRYGARVIATRIASDVGYQNIALLDTEEREIVEGSARDATVDIAIDGSQGLEGGDGVGKFDGAYIACVPNLIHIFQKVAQWLVKGAVSIGYNAYFPHQSSSVLVVRVEVVRRQEEGLTLGQSHVADDSIALLL